MMRRSQAAGSGGHYFGKEVKLVEIHGTRKSLVCGTENHSRWSMIKGHGFEEGCYLGGFLIMYIIMYLFVCPNIICILFN